MLRPVSIEEPFKVVNPKFHWDIGKNGKTRESYELGLTTGISTF